MQRRNFLQSATGAGAGERNARPLSRPNVAGWSIGQGHLRTDRPLAVAAGRPDGSYKN